MKSRFLALALLLVPVPALTESPRPADLANALHDQDLGAVRALARNARSPAERALAGAAVDYWQRRDEAAGPGLERAAHDPAISPDLRRETYNLLSGLRVRQSRYAEALAALDATLAATTDPEARAELERGRTFIAPLVGAPRMEARIGAPGEIALTRDATGHQRARVGVNGGTVDAIVDSGSGVSTLALSDARRLGVRMLTGHARIGTATTDVTTGLAIAERVRLGGAEFRNVVFLVMPDEALTFLNGAYVVHGIVGLPLMMPLGRLEYVLHGDGATQTLRYGPGRTPPGPGSNLIADGVEALALVRADDDGRQLRLFIDNGAPHTHLNRRFVADFPAIAARGEHQAVTTSGGGGEQTQADAMRLPSLVLHIADRAAPLAAVPVIDDHHSARHGDIGLDALETGRGYVLDFNAMRVELLP